MRWGSSCADVYCTGDGAMVIALSMMYEMALLGGGEEDVGCE